MVCFVSETAQVELQKWTSVSPCHGVAVLEPPRLAHQPRAGQTRAGADAHQYQQPRVVLRAQNKPDLARQRAQAEARARLQPRHQGLTLVHFSAQPEPLLTQNTR